MNESSVDVFDYIETAIVGLLQPLPVRMGDRDIPFIPRGGSKKHSDAPVGRHNYWAGLKLEPIPMDFPWVTDIMSDRLLSLNPEDWLFPIETLLGQSFVLAHIKDYDNLPARIEYNHYRPIKRLPKQFYTIRKQGVLYWEHRNIVVYENLKSTYDGELLAWNTQRQAHELVMPRGTSPQRLPGQLTVEGPREMDMRRMLTLNAAAGFADSLLGTWHVDIWQDRGIKLSTDAASIRDLAAIREGPRTPGGRKRPILHWVRQHLRKKRDDTEKVVIPKHLRGIEGFEIDGFMFRIQEPTKP